MKLKLKTVYMIILAVILISFCIVMFSAFSNIAVHGSTEGAAAAGPHILIDAGHGGEDGGAEVDGVLEKDINLSISHRLADLLRLTGYTVDEIRTEDISVYDDDAETLRQKKVSDLQNRVERFNESADNIVVSIHQNKFDNSAYSGTQLFYSPNHQDSSVLAEAIRRSVVALLQPDNTRELKPAGSDIYILKQAKIPAVIVECGFLSNPEERANLLNEAYQGELAYSIAMGVLEYIEATE